MNFRCRKLVLSLAAVGLMPTTVVANTLQLSQESAGEVLIYPYYTVRNGTISLLSLVNGSNDAKAVRLRVREAIGGRTVAELNVFLSPKDVWTAAIVPTTDGATIVSNDKSCTHPKISGGNAGLVFSSAGFASDDAAYSPYTPADRTREGYVEVIEMASVEYGTALGKDITHVAGVAACKLTGDPSSAAIQSTLAVPSGGLFGGMSFINLNDGISVSYNATAVNGFWKTGPGAPVPTITAPLSPSAANPASAPDLTSGGNATITVTDKGKTYVSTFARSIDAMSALFMTSTISAEYATTADGTFGATLVVTSPTKPYYIYGESPRPFENLYEPAFGKGACDNYEVNATDRDEFFPASYETDQLCDVAAVLGLSPGPFTAFNSPRVRAINSMQAAGVHVAVPGKEGGYLEIQPTYANAQLIPTNSSVLTRSAASGALEWVSATHTYVGLPMIGFVLSVSKYKVGAPQQNFGNLNPLGTRRNIR